MNLVHEGKVKSVYDVDGDAQRVIIKYHDKVTAGNGRLVEFPEEKGKICCLISALLFELMEKNNIKTHYLGTEGLDSMLCRKLTIIPVEVIVRNIAAGSLVKNTNINEGCIIQPPIVEYFLKDDERDDPLLTYDRVRLMGIDPAPMKAVALDVNYQLQSLFTLMGLDTMLTAIYSWLMNYHLTTCDSGKRIRKRDLIKTYFVKMKETLLKPTNTY
jgi:phosphoribosylaminoimidazole-succinocarboxamide synthase